MTYTVFGGTLDLALSIYPKNVGITNRDQSARCTNAFKSTTDDARLHGREASANFIFVTTHCLHFPAQTQHTFYIYSHSCSPTIYLSFWYAAPCLWNELPTDLCEPRQT